MTHRPSEKARQFGSLLSRFVSTLLGLLIGVAGTYGLYSADLISWSVPIVWGPVVIGALAVFGAVAVVTLVLLARSKAVFFNTAAFLGAVFLGVAGSVVAPGVLGERPAWVDETESVVYSLEIDDYPISEQLLQQLGNPLEGKRSTLNYVHATEAGGFVMVSSAGDRNL